MAIASGVEAARRGALEHENCATAGAGAGAQAGFSRHRERLAVQSQSTCAWWDCASAIAD